MNNDEEKVGTAQAYYNDSRKRSFFYSRVFVIASMLVLFIALGINISLLANQTNTNSNASYTDPSKLPALPSGCEYVQNGTKTIVTCATEIPINVSPTANPAFPISVNLPTFPPQCSITSSTTGSEVTCTSQAAIPTAPVTLPSTCKPGVSGVDSVDCTDTTNQVVTVALPALPKGCLYEKTLTTLSVSCTASNTVQ